MDETKRITAADAEPLARALDYYQHLVSVEFSGLTTQQIYELSFSRLAKPNPRLFGEPISSSSLQRPGMLGADERDAFLPVIRDILGSMKPGIRLFDVGCGDGETIRFLLNDIPAGSTVNFEDPNPNYLESYRYRIQGADHDLVVGEAVPLGFDEMFANCETIAMPREGSQDLCLSIHMIYFVEEFAVAVERMVRLLKPGGKLFLVFADTRTCFTGRAVRNYLKHGNSAAYMRRRQVDVERMAFLGVDESESVGTSKSLTVRIGDIPTKIDLQIQDTYLYGHTLGDILALGFIGGLAVQDDCPVDEKIASVRRLLQVAPETVSLSIRGDGDGMRSGMWSVSEPQVVAVLSRLE